MELKLLKMDKPALTLFAIMAIYHMMCNINYGDDVNFFANVLAGSQDYLGDTIRFSIDRYNTWSSRTIIEIFVIYFAHWSHIVWRIADTMMWMLMYFSMSNLLELKTEKMRWCLTILFLLFPFKYTGTAGWICTSLNYTWPAALGCYVLLCLKCYRQGVALSKVHKVCGLLALIYSINEEQMIAILFIILSGMILNDLRNKKLDAVTVLSHIMVDIGAVYSLTCPGNAARALVEVSNRMPEFLKYNIWEKLDLGYVHLINSYFQKFNVVSVMMCIIIYFLFIQRCKRHSMAVGLALSWSILCQIVVKADFWGEILEIHGMVDLAPVTVLQYAISLGMLMAILYAMYVVGKSVDDYMHTLGVWAVGLISALIMGWSPTVYASGTRIFVFLFVASIYTGAYMLKRMDVVFLEKYMKYSSVICFVMVIRTMYFVMYKQ